MYQGELRKGETYTSKALTGTMEVYVSADPDYPGVDVEFVPAFDHQSGTLPRIVFEETKDKGLRLLVWRDPNSEDFTDKIILRGV